MKIKNPETGEVIVIPQGMEDAVRDAIESGNDPMEAMQMKHGGIHINPANKGKFNATKKATGKTTEELTHSKNPLTRKRAIFAQNASRWKHQDGGQAMQQQQQQQPQGGGQEDQMQQLVQMAEQALAQGTPPEEVAQMLIQQGVPEQVVQQVIQYAIQDLQQQQQAQGQSPQGQNPQEEVQEQGQQQNPQEEQAEMRYGGYMQGGGNGLSKEATMALQNPNIRSQPYINGAYETFMKTGDTNALNDYNAYTEANKYLLQRDSVQNANNTDYYPYGNAPKQRFIQKGYGGMNMYDDGGMAMYGNGGGIDNPGFRALPAYVQQDIINNMRTGGRFLRKAVFGVYDDNSSYRDNPNDPNSAAYNNFTATNTGQPNQYQEEVQMDKMPLTSIQSGSTGYDLYGYDKANPLPSNMDKVNPMYPMQYHGKNYDTSTPSKTNNKNSYNYNSPSVGGSGYFSRGINNLNSAANSFIKGSQIKKHGGLHRMDPGGLALSNTSSNATWGQGLGNLGTGTSFTSPPPTAPIDGFQMDPNQIQDPNQAQEQLPLDNTVLPQNQASSQKPNGMYRWAAGIGKAFSNNNVDYGKGALKATKGLEDLSKGTVEIFGNNISNRNALGDEANNLRSAMRNDYQKTGKRPTDGNAIISKYGGKMMQDGGKPSLKNQILNTRLPATNRPTLNPNFNRSTSTTSPLSLQALGEQDYGVSLNKNGLNLSAGLNLEGKNPAFRTGVDYGKGNWSGSANYSTDNNNFGTQVGYNNNGFNAGAGYQRNNGNNSFNTNAGYSNNGFNVGAGYQRNNNNNSFNANVGYDGDSPVNFGANYAYDKGHSFDTNVGLNSGRFSGGLNYGYNQEGDRAHNFGANANLGLGKNLNVNADANFDSNKNYQVNAGLKYNFQDGGATYADKMKVSKNSPEADFIAEKGEYIVNNGVASKLETGGSHASGNDTAISLDKSSNPSYVLSDTPRLKQLQFGGKRVSPSKYAEMATVEALGKTPDQILKAYTAFTKRAGTEGKVFGDRISDSTNQLLAQKYQKDLATVKQIADQAYHKQEQLKHAMGMDNDLDHAQEVNGMSMAKSGGMQDGVHMNYFNAPAVQYGGSPQLFSDPSELGYNTTQMAYGGLHRMAGGGKTKEEIAKEIEIQRLLNKKQNTRQGDWEGSQDEVLLNSLQKSSPSASNAMSSGTAPTSRLGVTPGSNRTASTTSSSTAPAFNVATNGRQPLLPNYSVPPISFDQVENEEKRYKAALSKYGKDSPETKKAMENFTNANNAFNAFRKFESFQDPQATSDGSGLAFLDYKDAYEKYVSGAPKKTITTVGDIARYNDNTPQNYSGPNQQQINFIPKDYLKAAQEYQAKAEKAHQDAMSAYNAPTIPNATPGVTAGTNRATSSVNSTGRTPIGPVASRTSSGTASASNSNAPANAPANASGSNSANTNPSYSTSATGTTQTNGNNATAATSPSSGWTSQKFKTREGIVTTTGVDLNKDPSALWEAFRQKYTPTNTSNLRDDGTYGTKEVQENLYDTYLDTPEGRSALKDMWKEYGLNIGSGQFGRDKPVYKEINDRILKGEDLTDRDLEVLRGNFIDDLRGKRLPKMLEDKPVPGKTTEIPKTPPEDKGQEVDKKKLDIETADKKADYDIPAINAYIPQSYGRNPIGLQLAQAQTIRPAKLNIQAELNENNRGMRGAFRGTQGNTSVNVAQQMQGLNNLYGAQNKLFGQKYNFDEQSRAGADQFNAQAIMNTDAANIQRIGVNQDAIARREGAIDTQRRTDFQAGLENADKQNAYGLSKQYIESTFGPYLNNEGKLNFAYDPATGEKNTKDKEKSYTASQLNKMTAEERKALGLKFGGSVKKIKLKLRK